MKYILLWTKPYSSPFNYLGSGCNTFIRRNCHWTNCYVTSDRSYLGYYTEFEAIVFNGPWLNIKYDIPKDRSTRQKYVYTNVESAANYPLRTNFWNGYFNWTWTYKLDSDNRWGYLAIRNATHHVVGPQVNMHWTNLSETVSPEIIQILKRKKKAAAWFSSNCYTRSNREYLVMKIQDELQRFGFKVDIYGACGKLDCPKNIMDRCLDVLENNYYFYFAFENALSEDYVTEKIVYALQHNTVPVVYGGANYTRFMPDGIYLDALKLGPKKLAEVMHRSIIFPEKYYYNFFKWKKHYSYHLRHESPDTDDYCQFCAMLNNDTLMSTKSVYNHIDTWWNTKIGYTDYSNFF
ncbi:alpha-(1,3)-fucosyltransferase C-like [Pectinophora gossypiella]|uniref:alpha-(1,3)-fucosyltransferase C-like n=1 Tax=Pectinophora gossypiella TaxID=13191 RepID=UPI00214EDC19|nr:alpha-(1,3)-fucosyltransferase C-like [Pectinophora gossypiella]